VLFSNVFRLTFTYLVHHPHLKDEMLDSHRLAWIIDTRTESVQQTCVQTSKSSLKNCHAQSSSRRKQPENRTHKTAYKFGRNQLSLLNSPSKLPLLNSGFLFLFLFVLSGAEARMNGGNRRTGEVLPYDPMDARYFL
jgi:hypothetical protein